MNADDAPGSVSADTPPGGGECGEEKRARANRVGVNRAAAGVCVAGVVSAAWWAFVVPVREPSVRENLLEQFDSVGNVPKKQELRFALDLADFRAPLWVAPPAPPAKVAMPLVPKPAPEPPAPPMKWQLLAIMLETGMEGEVTRRAMVYDPESDIVMALGAGEKHQGRTIESVGSGWLAIRDGKHAYTLRLDPQARGGSERAP